MVMSDRQLDEYQHETWVESSTSHVETKITEPLLINKCGSHYLNYSLGPQMSMRSV